MAYLQNEIGRLRATLGAAQQELTGLQQQLDSLVRQRTAATDQRAATQAQYDALQPLVAERTQKQQQLQGLDQQAAQQDGLAAGYEASASGARSQAAPMQARLAELQALNARIPAMQSTLSSRQQEVDRLADQLEAHDAARPPGSSSDYRDWQRERVALANQLQTAVSQRDSAAATLADARAQVAAIGGLQAQVDALLASAASYDSQAAAARQAAAGYRAQAAPIRTRVGELDAALAGMSAMVSQLATLTATIDSLAAQITTAQAAVAAAQQRVEAARRPLDELVALAAAIEHSPLDRPALERTAATLDTRLRALEDARTAARTRHADATRRAAATDGARVQRASDLDGVTAAITTAAGNVTGLTAQLNAQNTELTVRESAVTTAGRAITTHQNNKPEQTTRPSDTPPAEWLAQWREEIGRWWDQLENLQQQYEAKLQAVLATRQAIAGLGHSIDLENARIASLQARAAALRTEIKALEDQRDALTARAQAALAEDAGLEAPIAEFRAAREGATGRLLGGLPAGLPIVLFPVRVETRFSTGPTDELLVRIYPDDIHVDSHEPELTDEERAWAENYRRAVSLAGDDDDILRAAWEQLATRFGPARAAWLARAVDPSDAAPVGSRPASWTRAAHSRVLPDRWVLLGYRGGRVDLTAWSGTPVPDPLPLGPSPAAPADRTDPFQDPGIAWMVDFDTALETGMALRIPLSAEQHREGFDRLVVLGVKGFLEAGKEQWAEADGREAATRLAGLFHAHHHTTGLAFVPQHTPTNNTGAAASGWAGADPLDDELRRVERGAALIAPGDGSDALLAATALGLELSVFAHVRHADGREQSDAGAVNAALWRSFESDFLEAALGAPVPAALGGHFAAYVRARGPLPTLRVGKQPYGLLPVTSLARWVPRSGEDADLPGRLRALQRRWRLAGERVPGATRGDDVTGVLRQQAGACRYRVLGIGGITRQGTLGVDTLVAPFAGRLAALQDRAPDVLQALVAETLDLGSFRLDAWTTSLATRRLLEMPRPAQPAIHLGAYGWVEDVRRAGPRGSQGYLHAPSMAHAATAAILRSGYLAHGGAGGDGALAVDLSSERVRRARWALDGVAAGQPLGALLGYRFERGLHDRGLARYIASFRTLAAFTDDEPFALAVERERVLELEYQARKAEADALDAELGAADAVVRDLTAQREELTRQRSSRESVIAQLTQSQAAVDAAQALVDAAEQRIQEHLASKPRSRVNKPWNWDADTNPADDVYLPPTAALVAWQTELRARQASKQQAINDRDAVAARRDQLAGGAGQYGPRLQALQGEVAGLTSRITDVESQWREADRHADELEVELRGTDGNGGADRLKRDAHAAWMASADALHALLLERWQQARESVAAHNVVDGLELHRRWRMGSDPEGAGWNAATIPWGDATADLPALDDPDHAGIVAELTALDEMVDAVGDVLIAEGVYQLVQGNSARAGATLEAIASGELAPPELEVVRTPRTGTAVSHRVLALAPADPPAAAPWDAAPGNPRATAEPALNAWVALMLAHPADVRYRVAYLAADTGAVLGAPEPRDLAVLGLSPLDALYLSGSSGGGAQGELEQRLAYHASVNRPAGVPADARTRLDFERDPGWDPSVLSVGEFLENVRVVRAFVAGTRPVDATDLALPGQSAPRGIDVGELRDRADAAGQALRQAGQALDAALGASAATPASLGAALLPLAGFGIGGAVPVPGAGLAGATEQGRSVQAEVSRRLDRLRGHDARTPGDGEAAQRDHQIERMRIVFGEDFRVLPRCTPPQAAELAQAFAPERRLEGTEPLAPVTWLQQIGQVREAAGRFSAAAGCAEALATGAGLTLRVGQLPVVANDRWVALPPPAGGAVPAGRLSLVAHMPPGFRFSQPMVGMLVDEWVEVVPSTREVTGLAFHFDQPNAQPPQTVLLAVPPDTRPDRVPAAWDLDTLAAILQETGDLARARAATPEAMAATLWHTVRRGDGTWDGFTDVDAAAGRPEAWQAMSAAATTAAPATEAQLQLVAAASTGGLWHSLRTPAGEWGAFENVASRIGDRGTFRDVACAAVGDALHVCAVSSAGLWHTIRSADGQWQPSGDVEGQAGDIGIPVRVSCAAVGPELHVCVVTRDGRLWHTIRWADGSWQPFGDVEGPAGDRGHVLNVACAAAGATLHVCATSTRSGLWHAVRRADGSWTSFADVEAAAGARGYVEEMACAVVGDDFHLRILTTDSLVWHATRSAAGSWSAWRETPGIGQARRLACAAAGPALHLVDLGTDPLPTRLYFAADALDLNALPG